MDPNMSDHDLVAQIYVTLRVHVPMCKEFYKGLNSNRKKKQAIN